ncbi:patatin-like phospholipase family protein [Antrihabitans sp. YC2-6]|uniref:patatin-like phospholipase family protein n=1 Tax=Antrihabitans sp. YC2-6 TaxID=2799498 RepID=UPI0018F62A32|nr:patatin-like phospholipase family protein [Antrihabitans sp. YC2-6]MBJ8346331.1 patatin-like phospholipase family protein [Antrihabitans sp. YC2-6]
MAKRGTGSLLVDNELAEPTGPLPDIAEAPEDSSLPRRNPVLALQHLEAALTRADLAHPDVLTRQEFRRLRYLISFARLTVFEPGAAGPGGTRGRGDVDVSGELEDFRVQVVAALHGPLREEQDLKQRLVAAKAVLEQFVEPLEELRQQIAERHANDFSLDELDAEVCYKSLVCVLGGGGGAGFVYVGGIQRLVEEGMVPDYFITSSIGSVVGSVIARTNPIPVEDYIDWVKTVTYRGILGPELLRRKHGLTGVFSLRFNVFAEEMFRREDGEQMRMTDMAIPYETVVAGVRKQSFDRLPGRFRRSELVGLGMRALPNIRLGTGTALATRLWQVSAFIDTRVVKPMVIGGDPLTEQFNVVDAASFSSAIPGVLHHESTDPRMHPLLDELMDQTQVAALVDGGAVSNVPAELAWRRIHDGKLGTRNACYYAWDCFHPQWNPKHLWLQPITQAISVQMVANAPFADRIVRFSPTLAATNLAPSAASVDSAVEWGRASVEESLPIMKHLLEPVWWDGDGPPQRPVVVPPKSSFVPESMSAIVEAARAAAEYVPAWKQVARRLPRVKR